MARLGKYNPKEVSLIIGTRRIDGFGPGTFIEVTRTNPKEITATVGGRGEYSLSQNPDRSGTVSFILQAESASNIYLQSLVGSGAIIPLFVNRTGETIREVITSPESWVEEKPQKAMDDTGPDRVWIMGAGDLQQNDIAA